MIRVAIIGLGHIGRTHVAALAHVEGCKLVSGCDRDVTLASVLPEGLPFFSSHYDLLSVGGFETVVVATPNQTHAQIAFDVLNAGYHVIVEKPAANSVGDLNHLQQLAIYNSRHVYYAFHAAEALEVDALVSHIDNHSVNYGPLTSFYCRFYDPYIRADGLLSPCADSLDNCWSDSGINALSVIDRILSVDQLSPRFSRKSIDPTSGGRVNSFFAGFHFPTYGIMDSGGFGIIDTAWDLSCNFKATSLFFGTTGWRLNVNHSNQILSAVDPKNQQTILARFDGDRLLNHYLGVFSHYVDLYSASQSAMNFQSASRIHMKLFESAEVQ